MKSVALKMKEGYHTKLFQQFSHFDEEQDKYKEYVSGTSGLALVFFNPNQVENYQYNTLVCFFVLGIK